jgi:hypothetical protein
VELSDDELGFVNGTAVMRDRFGHSISRENPHVPELLVQELAFWMMARQMQGITIEYLSVNDLAELLALENEDKVMTSKAEQNIATNSRRMKANRDDMDDDDDSDDVSDGGNATTVLQRLASTRTHAIVFPCLDLISMKLTALAQEGSLSKYQQRYTSMSTYNWLTQLSVIEPIMFKRGVFFYPSMTGAASMLLKHNYMKVIESHTLRTYFIDPRSAFSVDDILKVQLPYNQQLVEEESYCAICSEGGELVQCDKCNDWYHYDEDACTGLAESERKIAQHAAQHGIAFVCSYW